MTIQPKTDRAKLPTQRETGVLLGFSGHKQEKLTLAKLHKHLTEGEVREAVSLGLMGTAQLWECDIRNREVS